MGSLCRGGSRISGKGFICIKVWGFALLILSHFSYISHENKIIWSETKLFHFHGIFQNGGGEGHCSAEIEDVCDAIDFSGERSKTFCGYWQVGLLSGVIYGFVVLFRKHPKAKSGVVLV